jgi:Fe-S cluster biogenesis protein NfuA
MIHKGNADFRQEPLAREWSPLASALFDLPYVKGVYITNNFVTITKELNFGWEDIMLSLKNFLKEYIESDKGIVKEGYDDAMLQLEIELGASYDYSEEDATIVKKIKDLIATYVKPAVEMDGGNIEFKAYDAGKVIVTLEGACSGCPSSTVTLKAGIEGMLKRMIPQITEVVAEMG